MELVRVINKEIVQVFTDDEPVKIEGVGQIMNPKKVSLSKWESVKCYPVIQPTLNRFQIAGDIVLDFVNKKAYRPAVANPDIDLEKEKAALKVKYISKAKAKLNYLWFGDDDKANGAIINYFQTGQPSQAEQDKYNEIKQYVVDKLQAINAATELDQLLTL